LAKIAAELERALASRHQNGAPAAMTSRVLARGDDWSVEDLVCTAGPHDKSCEEQHARICIAVVLAGTFQYRASGDRPAMLMAPASLLLGNTGQYFECSHEHASGDRACAFATRPSTSTGWLRMRD
jgi:AraC family transcriptional regulator